MVGSSLGESPTIEPGRTRLKERKLRGREVLITCCGTWYWSPIFQRIEFYYNSNRRTGINDADIEVTFNMSKNNLVDATKRACKEEVNRLNAAVWHTGKTHPLPTDDNV